MEVVDINLDNIPVSSDATHLSESSFGGGVELLMNEKKKSSSQNTKIDIEDLDLLENELNDLSHTQTNAPTENNGGDAKVLSGISGFGNLFSFGDSKTTNTHKNNDSNTGLGKATNDTSASSKTWDGFTKVSGDVPFKERPSSQIPEREKRRKKRIMIKKLEEWGEKGTYKYGSAFTMDSNFDEVEDEYESALEEKRKKDSIKLQGWWFTTVVNTMEYGNALLNPFDLNLDGWGEQVSEDLDSYEEIFSELHEKYKGGKMAPEVSLLLRLGFSAAVVNMSNKMLSSATPGVNDVIKQSPELMKMFTNAAVDTMSKENSAFDFARTMMNPPEEINTRHGPPPAPVETKTQPPPKRPGSTMTFTEHPGNRPDLEAAKTPMFRESGIDNNNFHSTHQSDKIITRPEMKGPQITPGLDELLSGLKPKNQSFEPSQNVQPLTQHLTTDSSANEDLNNITETQMGTGSVISVTSLKSLEGTQMPKKTKRKKNISNKNSVSLDI